MATPVRRIYGHVHDVPHINEGISDEVPDNLVVHLTDQVNATFALHLSDEDRCWPGLRKQPPFERRNAGNIGERHEANDMLPAHDASVSA
jgi:hypothetical protein